MHTEQVLFSKELGFTQQQVTTTIPNINFIIGKQTKPYDNSAETKDSLIIAAKEFNKAATHWYFEKEGQIPFEQYRRIESEKAKEYSEAVTVKQMALPNNKLHLGTHTRCTCEETGICFAVELPSPLDTTLSLLHPFAFYSNVNAFIRQYQKHGLTFNTIEEQVLAGMLITVLTQKKLTTCYDPIKANERLKATEKHVLIQALGYFNRLQSTTALPSINLLEQGNPTQQLLNYMGICKGTDLTVQTLHMHEKKIGRIGAKIFCPKCQTTDCDCSSDIKTKVPQTEQEKQELVLKQDIRSCNKILSRLITDNPTVSKATIKLFENKFNKLGVMNDQAKTALIHDLYDVFDETDTTKALTLIIKSINTDEIQKELLTFTQQLEQEQKEFMETKQPREINPEDKTGLRALWNKRK